MRPVTKLIIKHEPADFKVRERPLVGHERDDCVVADVEKDNWDTTLLVKELARSLGISQKSVGYAGLKDKTAVSVQKMSFHGVDEERVRSLRLPGVSITNIGRGDRINIGELEGNEFEIAVRDIALTEDELMSRIESSVGRFQEWHGFVNYFGYQRFGLQRPVTADVGKYIVKKDYESAALTYIGRPYPNDPFADVRKEFLEDIDFKRAYNEFPQGLRYERAMLFALAHDGKDYRDCFKALPERLLKLFVHGYQSKLFNEIVEGRTRDVPPNVAEIGDHIVMDRYERKATSIVNRSNIGRVEAMLKDDVSVSGPLIGFRTKLPSSTMGEIASDVMEREGIAFDDFRNDDMRLFESSGTEREILARYGDLSYDIRKDELFGNRRCDITFFLKKGEYATEFLRQLFNEEAIPQGMETL